MISKYTKSGEYIFKMLTYCYDVYAVNVADWDQIKPVHQVGSKDLMCKGIIKK